MDGKNSYKKGEENKTARPFDIKLALNDIQPVDSDPRAGSPCPNCPKGVLDYDGLLNLSCMDCGYALAGCFS
jgi:hypothetical protein